MVDPKSIVSQAAKLPTVHPQTSFLVGALLSTTSHSNVCCCGAGSVDQWHPAQPGYLWYQGGNAFRSVVVCHGVATSICKEKR